MSQMALSPDQGAARFRLPGDISEVCSKVEFVLHRCIAKGKEHPDVAYTKESPCGIVSCLGPIHGDRFVIFERAAVESAIPIFPCRL